MRSPAIAWSWDRILPGAIYAIPAFVVIVGDPARGLPLALGVLPAAMLPMPSRRRGRLVILVIGVLCGLSLLTGGLLAQLPVPGAAVLLVGAVVGAALVASVLPSGRLVLTLCAPLVAAGMSYSDLSTALGSFLLLSAGAAYAFVVSLLWPPRVAPVRATLPLPGRAEMLRYGFRIGSAAGIAFLIAAGLRYDHPGWAPAACLLVARPQVDLLRLRGLGRIVSVAVGALVAELAIRIGPPNLGYALLVIAVLVGASATVGSRWYISSAFSTCLVFLTLVHGHQTEAGAKFDERLVETIIGVALAVVFAWGVPVLTSRLRPAG